MVLSDFEQVIWEFIQPVQTSRGLQLPRPWYTTFDDPLTARVFIVGANQAKAYDPNVINVDRHFSGLFNRDGETCTSIYSEATGGKVSPTRRNIQKYLVGKLQGRGIADILETNVVCHSSPYFSDLSPNEKADGSELFRYLLKTVQPKILVIFGKGARNEFSKRVVASQKNRQNLANRLAEIVPDRGSDVRSTVIDNEYEVFCIPGLVMGGLSQWADWIDEYTDQLADVIVQRLEIKSSSNRSNEITLPSKPVEIKGGVPVTSETTDDDIVKNADALGHSNLTKISIEADWLECQVEAIKTVENPFRHNTKRWKRHELLLECRRKLPIREYNRLLTNKSLPRLSKKYLRSAIDYKCVYVFDSEGQPVARNNLLEILK